MLRAKRSDAFIVWSHWTVVESVVDGDQLFVLRNVDEAVCKHRQLMEYVEFEGGCVESDVGFVEGARLPW